MKLLIVNDETLTAETMKKEIDWEQYGISGVETAYDATMARERIAVFHPDILLCDIEMPGENGLSLLRWVRENGWNLECVFLTCHASFSYAQEAISLGCRDYILIPAEYEHIGNVIRKVVDRIGQQREAARYQAYGERMMKKTASVEAQKSKEEEEEISCNPAELARRVEQILLENFRNQGISVNSIAEQLHFHPVYLNRIFKKEVGITISQYLINERMKLAAALLETGAYTVHEIAETVGYSHYTNFFNMFKKTYGVSPADYRRE